MTRSSTRSTRRKRRRSAMQSPAKATVKVQLMIGWLLKSGKSRQAQHGYEDVTGSARSHSFTMRRLNRHHSWLFPSEAATGPLETPSFLETYDENVACSAQFGVGNPSRQRRLAPGSGRQRAR